MRSSDGGLWCTGGTSLLTQLRERLERELLEAAPPTVKVKITCPANSMERRFNVWLGAPLQHLQMSGPGLHRMQTPSFASSQSTSSW